MKLWKVKWNISGYQMEQIFDDYRDAKYFAEERALFGAQYIIVEI